MHFDLLMALVIAIVIMVMSSVKNSVSKAIVYGLPIPITVALIASQGSVNGSHVVGLFLLTGFLWGVLWMKKVLNQILLVDTIVASAYALLGYGIISKTPFEWESVYVFACAAISYAFAWIIFMGLVRPPTNKDHKNNKGISVVAKGGVVFGIAALLLSLKSVLQGIVVTFPFSGVFAVVEMQQHLDVLAYEFTKNSIAILIFFVVVYIASSHYGLYGSIALGWVAYVPTLKIVRML